MLTATLLAVKNFGFHEVFHSSEAHRLHQNFLRSIRYFWTIRELMFQKVVNEVIGFWISHEDNNPVFQGYLRQMILDNRDKLQMPQFIHSRT